MRAPKNEATGTSGQSFVKAKFEELGWGAVPNPEHDLGTDLWLQARDERRFDLGALVGAQVKTGPSYFDEPEAVDGEIAGWWYRDDDAHFNYWCNHRIPHILVLHRMDDNTSFWVDVTADKVESTGRGRKILVPASSTIDADHFELLLAVASRRPDVVQWEGSAWKVGRDVASGSRLRYALLTPRLIAPHPNSKTADLNAEQAIALLVQMRVHDLCRYAETQPLTDPANIDPVTDSRWQLFGALHRWLLKGELDGIDTLETDSLPPDHRSAIAVIRCHAYLEAGRTQEALDVLDTALLRDDANPVDNGWLNAQRARCLADLGRVDEARETALEIQALRHVAPDDPTAGVLVGSAAQVIFDLGDWGEKTLADVIQSRDNVAAWWRSQTLVTALDMQFDQVFKAWGKESSVTHFAEDVVWNRFRSSMLLAGYAADSAAWRHSASLLAQHQLMSSTDADTFVWALDLLRLAGAEKETKLAAGRLIDDGPISPLLKVAAEIDLDLSGRSSLKSDLSFLERVADALPSETCDRHVNWGISNLEALDALTERLKPQFWVPEAIINMVAALVPGASDSVRADVMAHVASLPVIEDQLLASRYARLIRTIGSDPWTPDQAAALCSRPEGDNFELTQAIDKVRAEREDGFRSSLVTRIASGDISALGNYGDVTDLPPDAAAGMIHSLATSVTNQTAAARNGTYRMGGIDVLRTLTLLNAWHPDQAKWDPVEEALAESASHVEHIVGAIDLLGILREQVPGSERARLEPLLRELASEVKRGDSGFGAFISRSDSRASAALALARISPQSVSPAELLELLSGEPSQRAAAAEIITFQADDTQIGLLVALSADVDAEVRAAVAHGLAYWVTQGVARPLSALALKKLLAEPGLQLGKHVSEALANADGDGAELLAQMLHDHPSTVVLVRLRHFRERRVKDS
ncbi:DUF4365 domain-containing protein [Parenemella sanctibonifatiensis]|nr:DUF4365 domain-containing protein [Parenemella sanctibonifatiensis]